MCIRDRKVVVLVIDVHGAANIRRMFPGATTVFLLPPSVEELERRLRGRGDVYKRQLLYYVWRERYRVKGNNGLTAAIYLSLIHILAVVLRTCPVCVTTSSVVPRILRVWQAVIRPAPSTAQSVLRCV